MILIIQKTNDKLLLFSLSLNSIVLMIHNDILLFRVFKRKED